MRYTRFKILIAILSLMAIITSCTDNIIRKKNKLNLENKENSKIESNEESFNYFQYKWLIEEFPFDNLNSSNFYREYLKTVSLKQSKFNFRSIPKWESLGPNNIAGRTLCLAINPKDTNQLWMGSAGAGLWKSDKGGIGSDVWHYVATGFPVIAVSSIAIQNDQPQIIYIGTGEIYNLNGSDGGIQTRTLRGSRGLGILKSIDGGLHWNLCLDWTQGNQTAVWKIIIHPKNPNIVFAATNLGIYKSVDAGDNWFTILDLPLAMDLIIDHQDPNILYSGIGGINGTHYGVYKSVDEGQNWNLIQTPNDTLYQGRIMLANYKTNPKRVIAAYSDDFKTIAMMRSKDGFDSSNFYIPIKDISEHQGWYAKCLHIKDDDSSRIIMGGVDLYLDSTGTGNQFFNLLYWKIKIHADLHDIISNPLDPNKIYIATDGGLFRSNDFAHSFYSCNHGYLSAQFYTGNVSSKSNYLLGGLQDNKSAIYSNSNGWKNIHQADGTFNAFNPLNDSILFVSSQYQNLYVSYNFGGKWKELIKPNLTAAFVSPFLIHSKDPNLMYSGGNNLLISHNSGQSWDTTHLSSNDETIVAMETDSQNMNTIYLSTLNVKTRESHLYYSMDQGAHLQSKEIGIPERFIRDISIDQQNSNTIYLALGGYELAGFMISQDAGENWSFPENLGLPNVPIHTVLVDPKDNNIIYTGCEFGLYVSLNRGKTWIPYNAHPFDLVAVYDLKYSPIDDELIIFTHGFGAFRCSLLDKTIITKSSTLNPARRFYDQINESIFLSEEFGHINELKLVSIEGKLTSLRRAGMEFSTKALKSGVYFFLTNEPTIRGTKLIITR